VTDIRIPLQVLVWLSPHERAAGPGTDAIAVAHIAMRWEAGDT